MNQQEEAILKIARKFGFSTLETRNSDRLDFREMAVWDIKSMLQLAFAAGCAFKPEEDETTKQNREAVQKRIDAAKAWAFVFSYENPNPMKSPQKKALAVLTTNSQSMAWLAEHDCSALRQAQESLNGKSYCDYLKS